MMYTQKQILRAGKVSDRMRKELTDSALDKVIEVAKELANELCPTTEPFFMEVTTSILMEASTKAITDYAKDLKSAAEGHTITTKLFGKMLTNRLEKKFFSSPEQLIASLKALGAWKE